MNTICDFLNFYIGNRTVSKLSRLLRQDMSSCRETRRVRHGLLGTWLLAPLSQHQFIIDLCSSKSYHQKYPKKITNEKLGYSRFATPDASSRRSTPVPRQTEIVDHALIASANGIKTAVASGCGENASTMMSYLAIKQNKCKNVS